MTNEAPEKLTSYARGWHAALDAVRADPAKFGIPMDDDLLLISYQQGVFDAKKDMAKPKAKELEWVDRTAELGFFLLEAKTVVGCYCIEKSNAGYLLSFIGFDSKYPTEEAAKAAAQAHFQTMLEEMVG